MNYLRTPQFVALILGICFTVLAVATAILAFALSKKFKSFAKAITFILITPFLACVSWLYLLLSFMDGLRGENKDVICLVIAILLSIFAISMVVIVSKALYSKHGPALEEYDRAQAQAQAQTEEQANTEEAKNENVEENAENLEDTQSRDLVVSNRNNSVVAKKGYNKKAEKPKLLPENTKEDEETIIVEVEDAKPTDKNEDDGEEE